MNYLPNDETFHGGKRAPMDGSENPRIPNLHGTWDALGISVPTISAYAYLCAHALFHPHTSSDPIAKDKLTGQAKAILYLAKQSGALELKVMPRGFRATERFLALHVHVNEDECLVFQDANDLRVAIQYLHAFRELCLAGLCIHQLHGEFSLNQGGFELAQSIHEQEVEPWLTQAQNSSAM